MQVSQAVPSPDHAIEALQWSRKVATEDLSLLNFPPARPKPEEHRAVPLEIFREAMDEILMGKYVEEGMDALYACGALDVWLPEIAAMVGFGDGEWRHKDVWKHTKQVVFQSTRRLEIRWAALLHDIGKPKTRSIDERGHVHFHGHSEVGAAMFRRKVAKRLGFRGEMYQKLHFLILNHLRANQYDGSWTDAACRRFYKEMGDDLEDLFALSRADITTKRPEKKKRGVRQINDLSARIKMLKEADSKTCPIPKGLGHLLMEKLGIPPSKKLGDIRNKLIDEVEAGIIQGDQDCDYYIDWIEQHKDKYLD